MDGPWHYHEAERLLALAASEDASSEGLYTAYDEQAALILADALVHATLANAAAVALGHSEGTRWRDVAGSARRPG